MSKATHKGECQLCGRIQRLPKSKLSLHGYTVQWQMFEGTCLGSRELPYEQSCDLIVNQIPSIQAKIAAMKLYKNQLLESSNQEAYTRVYLRSTRSYHWKKVKLIEVQKQNEHSGWKWTEIHALYNDGDRQVSEKEESYGETLLECAARLNKAYAEGQLTKNIIQLEQYLDWCENRVNKWELKELQKI